TQHLGIPTLYLVNRLSLLHQMVDNISKFLSIPKSEIGMIGDNSATLGKWITVATPESLQSKLHYEVVQEYINKWQLLVYDEVNQIASSTSIEVFNNLKCHYRVGLSATPLQRSDGDSLSIIGYLGDIIYEISNSLLIERGVSVRPHLEIHEVNKGKLIPR